MIVGNIYMVKFLDHVSDDGHAEPAVCVLYGKLTSVHDTYLTITCWVTDDSENPGEDDAYAILRSTIVSLDEMVKV